MTTTLEIAEFETVANAGEDAVLAAAHEAGVFLARQPGFVARRLARRPEGDWVDIVEWESLDAAKAAAQAFPAAPEAASFMQVIAKVSRMTHAGVQLSG
jgi:heme-degrading monooxygenase HmoA